MNELSKCKGNVTTSMVVNFQMWCTLTTDKSSHFVELEIKRNRLKNTRPMHVDFVRLYFGEKSALLNAAQADQDCRPSQQGFRVKWRQKRLRVFRAHLRIILWQSEVIWLLTSLRHDAR